MADTKGTKRVRSTTKAEPVAKRRAVASKGTPTKARTLAKRTA